MCQSTKLTMWVIAVALTSFIGLSSPAIAGDGKWTTNGPFGGRIFSIAIDPVNTSTLYAGTSNGIFKSTDGGAHWNVSFAVGHEIPSISIAAANPNVVYAAGSSTVYRSVDAGRSWITVKKPEVIKSPYGSYSNSWMQTAVAVFPRSPAFVYAADPAGVYMSGDGGKNWMNIAPSEVTGRGSAPILVDPNNPYVVYVGGGGFKTTSGDTNWVRLNVAIGNAARVNVLKMNPKNPNTLYAIVNNVFPWEPIVPGEGIFKSYDAGHTWTRIDSTVTTFEQDTFDWLTIDPVDTNIVYMGAVNQWGNASGAIRKSTDGGATWNTLYTYSNDPWIVCNAFAVDPANNSTVYVGLLQDGMIKTTDGGATWNASGYGILGATMGTVLGHHAVVLRPTDEKTIFVSALGGYQGGGLFKSSDGGQNWATLNNGLVKDVSVFRVNPNDPNFMYAATHGGLFMSTDAGATWTKNTSFPADTWVENLVINQQNSSIMYATNGYDRGKAVWKTEDGGLNWTKIATVGSGWDGMIIELVIDPNNPNTLYAGNQMFAGTSQLGAISRSRDGGATWTKIVPSGAFRIAVHPKNPAVIYYGTSDKGISVSSDTGKTWKRINNGLGEGLNMPDVTDIVIDPVNPNTIYVSLSTSWMGDSRGGVYRSVNGGDSWEPMPMEGLWWREVAGLTLNSRTSTLYASVDNGGVYSFSLKPTIAAASVKGIVDVPNDQGKQVRLTWKASTNDRVESERPIVQYGIWRKLDARSFGAASKDGESNIVKVKTASEVFSGNVSEKIGKRFIIEAPSRSKPFGADKGVALPPAQNSMKGSEDNNAGLVSYEAIASGQAKRDRAYRFMDMNIKTAKQSVVVNQANSELIGYEAVAVVPAIQDSIYRTVVPTLFDSTKSSGIRYSTFIVTAHTQDPFIWGASAPDSGYSVDNLAPTAPGSLVGTIQNGRVTLNWQHVPDYNDLSHFAVYRDVTANFTPDSIKLIGRSTASTLVDSSAINGKNYYYKVSAFDRAGNESKFSNEIVLTVTSVRDATRGVPQEFALSQNYPNPFNPETLIEYQLPKASAVTIKIYNTLGQEVKTLVNDYATGGFYSVRWNGTDDAGRKMASGIYLYRIQAGDFVQIRKMSLLK